MEQFLYYIGTLLAFGMGLGCGSYATMPYYRLPNGVASSGKWGGKRSYCTKCEARLRTRDLVPVFNRIWNRGKCYSCGVKVDPVYWFIELSATIAATVLYFQHGFGGELLVLFGLCVCLIILCATDYTYRMIPRQVLVTIVLFGFLKLPLEQFFSQFHVFALGIMVCLSYAKLKEKKQGKPFEYYGYLQLICLAGFWMPMSHYIVFLLCTVVFCVAARLFNGSKERHFPYAFCITAAWAVIIFFHQQLDAKFAGLTQSLRHSLRAIFF